MNTLMYIFMWCPTVWQLSNGIADPKEVRFHSSCPMQEWISIIEHEKCMNTFYAQVWLPGTSVVQFYKDNVRNELVLPASGEQNR